MDEISKDKLKEIYESMSNEATAKAIGVSVPTLMKILKKYEIELKGSGRPYRNVEVVK